MTDLLEHRAWVRAVTRISDARNIIDNVQFLGLDPDIRKECEEIWNRLDALSSRMMDRIKEMEKEGERMRMIELKPDAWVVVEYRDDKIHEVEGVYATYEDAERYVISKGEDPIDSERYQIRGYERQIYGREKEEEE